jgi:hypothetical protein
LLPRRDTTGKPTLDRDLRGDPVLAAQAADALASMEPAERWMHGVHTWPAGLHADAAKGLLSLVPEGGVFDPFCGGGTVLIEAAMAGRPAWGRDLSPVARLVARLRTLRTDEATRTEARSMARRMTEAARRAPPPSARLPAALRDWYDEGTLAELTSLRNDLRSACGRPDACDAVGVLLWGAFSSMLVKVSQRQADTVRRFVDRPPRPPGTTATWFHRKVREIARRLEAYDAVGDAMGPVLVTSGDARTPPEGVPAVQGIVTSPPYPAVYDYQAYQDLRELWLGFSSDAEAEIGPRRVWNVDPDGAEVAWRRDTNAWMVAASAVLAPGGRMVVVIGDGLVRSGPIDALEPTRVGARLAGLTFEASASLARPDHARASLRWEHAVVFRREAASPSTR